MESSSLTTWPMSVVSSANVTLKHSEAMDLIPDIYTVNEKGMTPFLAGHQCWIILI